MAKSVSKKSGELADWICPEMAAPTPTNTQINQTAGAANPTDQPSSGDDEK